jgi:ribosomal protein S18 acetylase RimI-like enzyme
MLILTNPDDVTPLVELARETGVFYDHEIDTLREVFDDYFHDANDNYGHRCFTARRDGRIAGFVYLAPVEMTDRTWEMWWIAVSKDLQGKGVGGEIMRAIEAELAEAGCRVLLIETSALPHYEPTCKFYLKHGYREVARIPDYYRDGDDKLIYSKRIVPESRNV